MRSDGVINVNFPEDIDLNLMWPDDEHLTGSGNSAVLSGDMNGKDFSGTKRKKQTTF